MSSHFNCTAAAAAAAADDDDNDADALQPGLTDARCTKCLTINIHQFTQTYVQ